MLRLVSATMKDFCISESLQSPFIQPRLPHLVCRIPSRPSQQYFLHRSQSRLMGCPIHCKHPKIQCTRYFAHVVHGYVQIDSSESLVCCQGLAHACRSSSPSIWHSMACLGVHVLLPIGQSLHFVLIIVTGMWKCSLPRPVPSA
jgi:hypothetical protein